MKISTTVVSLLGAAFFFTRPAFSQSVAPDSAFVIEAVEVAVAGYDRVMRGQEVLYNGSEFIPIPEPYNGFPYFGSEYLEEGSIKYAGEVFHNVLMEYDLVQDQVAIEHYDQRGYVTQVKLHSDLVEYFEVLGHHFINVREDSGWSGLRPGYYDLLYDGDMKLLCKRKKSINEKIENGVVDVSFIERATYHLLRDGEAISVRKKASILKALDDKKKALKQFARANGLGNRNKEEMLISLIRHYESLD
ncbi:MAG TPA: hypothetical protein VKZ86_04390 [Cyclobacteriaceae bacterium]|nr:hypothetical protein [Cyclobacteriaceae bacterium]